MPPTRRGVRQPVGRRPARQALTRAQGAGRGAQEQQCGAETRGRQQAPRPAAPPHAWPASRLQSAECVRLGDPKAGRAPGPALAPPGLRPWPRPRRHVPKGAARGARALLAEQAVGAARGGGRGGGPRPHPSCTTRTRPSGQAQQPSRARRVETGRRDPCPREAPPPSVCSRGPSAPQGQEALPRWRVSGSSEECPAFLKSHMPGAQGLVWGRRSLCDSPRAPIPSVRPKSAQF